MKIAAIFLIGSCVLVLVDALSSSNDAPGTSSVSLPDSALYDDLQPAHVPNQLTPLSREKRSKKKVIVINQYYPAHPGSYHGGRYGGYPYNSYNSYPYGYSDHSGGHGGSIKKKLKKFVG